MITPQTFLSPQGRLGPRAFARAFIFLTGAMVIIQVLTTQVAIAFDALRYLLIFPYLCVFAKRLHDAGRSAWFWLLFLAGSFLVQMLAASVLMPVLSPDAYAEQTELQKAVKDSGTFAPFFEAAQTKGQEMVRRMSMTTLAGFLSASAVTGFIAARLRADPAANRYGPVTGERPIGPN